jgi:hypothetical protein
MTDLRNHKAQIALECSGQWLRVRNSEGAVLAYGIPSATTAGLYHFATASECLCPDSQHGHWCYHSRAVALLREQTAERAGAHLVATRISDDEVVWDRPTRQRISDADAATLMGRL